MKTLVILAAVVGVGALVMFVVKLFDPRKAMEAASNEVGRTRVLLYAAQRRAAANPKDPALQRAIADAGAHEQAAFDQLRTATLRTGQRWVDP